MPAELPGRSEVTAALQALKGSPAVPSEYLAFRQRLLDAQDKARQSAQSGQTAAILPVRADLVVMGDEPLATLVVDIQSALAGLVVAGQHGLPALLDRLEGQTDLARQLALQAAFATEPHRLIELATGLGAESETAIFTGRLLAAPFVTAAVICARASGAAVPTPSTTCPFCRALPSVAALGGEDGTRTLWCSLCAGAWGAPRVACPFCAGTTSLGMLRDPDVASHWVETCDACKGYIKVVDTRPASGAPFVPLAVAVGDLYLDIIAEKHHYARGVQHVAVA